MKCGFPGKILILSFLLLLIYGVTEAQMYQTVTPESAELLQTGAGKLYCPGCGMNLVKFYRTSHALKQSDGVAHQYCSMHCLVESNDQLGPDVMVVDASSLKMIRAGVAHYVVGSTKPGTMTMKSKYAFAALADAEKFATANGGEVMEFAAAVKIARSALVAEGEMIGKKRARVAKKGEKIFAKMCRGGDLPPFNSIAEAKTYLVSRDICGNLDDGQFQAVAIYLVGKNRAIQAAAVKIEVPHDAKCPVCGMFVAKYPQWAATLTTTDGERYYFDGVKDMMKFYFDPARFHIQLAPDEIASLTVSDYYTLSATDGRRGWYVIGANVYGPMGRELIPLQTEREARIFMEDHFGEMVIPFDGITEDLVHGLDR